MNYVLTVAVIGFVDDSALLKHEIAFVLGQMQNPRAVPALTRVLQDTKEDSMVRHEVMRFIETFLLASSHPFFFLRLEKHLVLLQRTSHWRC